MSQHEKSDLYKEGYQAGKADAKRLDEPSIHTLVDSMPGGLNGFLKGWGWLNFARAVEDESILLNSTDAQVDAAPLTDEAILAIEKQVAYLAKSRNDLTIKTVRECIDAAIAAGGAQEAVAWKVDGLNGYNESAPSVWLKKDNAEAAAARLFKSSITPLAGPLPRVAATALTIQAVRTLLIRHAESYSEWDDGSIERIDFGQYGFGKFARALLAASNGEQA